MVSENLQYNSDEINNAFQSAITGLVQDNLSNSEKWKFRIIQGIKHPFRFGGGSVTKVL